MSLGRGVHVGGLLTFTKRVLEFLGTVLRAEPKVPMPRRADSVSACAHPRASL